MTIIINTFDLTQWLSSNSGMIFEAIAWIIGIVVSLIILGIVAELIFSPFNGKQVERNPNCYMGPIIPPDPSKCLPGHVEKSTYQTSHELPDHIAMLGMGPKKLST